MTCKIDAEIANRCITHHRKSKNTIDNKNLKKFKRLKKIHKISKFQNFQKFQFLS
jgi:hypothetical protein